MSKAKNYQLKTALLIPHFEQGFKQESIPLNLSYLGAVLEEAGYFVSGFNLDVENISDKEILQFDVFGITFPSSVFLSAINLIKRIRKVNPGSKIIVGGSYPTLQPKECLKIKEIDYVVVSDGEISLVKLLKYFEGKLSIGEVPNLIYRLNGKIIQNSLEIIKDLDEIPFPAKHIFNISSYTDKQKAYGDIIASRGCPFKCTNCKPALDKISRYRLRDPEKVVEEMRELKEKYQVRHFTFSDSELVGPKKWVKQFTQEIIKQKLKITYSCNGRTDQVDKETLLLLRKSGCVFIGFGIESGSQEVIDQILNKGINLEQSKKIITQTEKIGIGTGAWFMIGMPGETEEQIRQTILFAQELACSIIEINIATPWPETDFYNIAKKNNWLITKNFSKMNEKKRSFLETEFLSAKKTSKLFKVFQSELRKNGWKSDQTATRFYHPHFSKKMIKLGFTTILHRGIIKQDLLKFSNWFWHKY